MVDTTNLTDTLKQIDSYIAEKKFDIAQGEKLKRLMKDSDFLDVIINGYFESEAQKLFNILTNPGIDTVYTKDEITHRLAGISHFREYVGTEGKPGTLEIAASAAPSLIAREEDERARVTAVYADDGEV